MCNSLINLDKNAHCIHCCTLGKQAVPASTHNVCGHWVCDDYKRVLCGVSLETMYKTKNWNAKNGIEPERIKNTLNVRLTPSTNPQHSFTPNSSYLSPVCMLTTQHTITHSTLVCGDDGH